MASQSPIIEPYEHGMLDVGDGHELYWEMCGNPEGRTAVILHGGPGSGCSERMRSRLVDPDVYRVVLFDQRNCGRSTPPASEPVVDLSANTTQHLVADIERLREHLGIERWLVWGGSWGSTLALAYAEEYPERVTGMILMGVTTGRHSEVEWLFRGGLSLFFPEQWDQLVEFLPDDERQGDVVAAIHRRLMDPDPAIHRPAADAWCLWESASPLWPPQPGLLPMFEDPDFALTFARIVTHYVVNDLFLEDNVLIENAGRLAGIPGAIINGRYDFQSPIGNAWAIHRVWPGAELTIVDDAGHHGGNPGLNEALSRAGMRLAG
jgi:proline iminopeptidase